MRAVTVSRMYGGGGGEVAARLAQRLGWRLLDHEMVLRVAHQLGLSLEEATARDEVAESFISRALSGMSLAYPSVISDVAPSPTDLDRAYREALRRLMLAEVEAGQVVIVGRGGFALLADRRDVLRVLITAPLPQRMAYVARREGLDERAARERIRRKDQERHRQLEEEYHVHAGAPERYDLCINTAVLSLNHAVALICLSLEQKAQQLTLSAAELGPGAGLAHYPGTPEDIHVPGGGAG
jgi:cytidylate kinase